MCTLTVHINELNNVCSPFLLILTVGMYRDKTGTLERDSLGRGFLDFEFFDFPSTVLFVGSC